MRALASTSSDRKARARLPVEEDAAINAPGDKDAAADAAAGAAVIDPQWLAEFEAAAKRPLALRWRYSFIHTYKPVLDDATYRSFDTMEEYRRWCEQNLPSWLGYLRGEDVRK